MSDNLENVLSDEEVEAILTQEGLQSIQDLFEFFTEALDVAVNWILHYDSAYTDEEVRAIISEQVRGKDLEQIVDKLSALTEIQEDL